MADQDILGQVSIINIPVRIDRRKGIIKNLAEAGINHIGFFHAWEARQMPEEDVRNFMAANRHKKFEYSAAQLACLRSHMAVLRQNHPTEWITVFEDDARVKPDFLEQFELFLKDVPPGWKILRLGGNARALDEGEYITDRVVRCKYGAGLTHAQVIRVAAISDLLSLMEMELFVVDMVSTVFDPMYGATYLTNPYLAVQSLIKSDIGNRPKGSYELSVFDEYVWD